MKKFLGLVLTSLASGCVQPFDGSHIELLWHGGVQVAGDTDPGNGRPPSDTHYELYVARDQSVFHLANFDFKPIIDLNDRCFIEDEASRFPGLHSTQIENKLIEVAMADGTINDTEAGQIADAHVRVANQPKLANSLKAMVAHEDGLTDKMIADFQATVPTPDKIDDDSNAARLAACRDFFTQHPGYYVGTDKILTIPTNGNYLGMVEGMDPRNNAFVGGAEVNIPERLDKFDAMRVNWNFNDPSDPRAAALPPSTVGYYYMAGVPVERVRGVYNVAMTNTDYLQISGDAAVWIDTGKDNVHF